MKLTSAQIGMLGEAVAATQLMSLSNGRFSKPLIIKVNETNLQRRVVSSDAGLTWES